jgi:hypothetical protein
MGPVILIDKSALEMLSIDQSVWLDEFFFTNICPMLYSETLADLTKSRSSRDNPVTAMQLVSEIAAKTPVDGVAPCMHHRNLIAQDMNGNHPNMDGRPIVRAGKIKQESSGRVGMDLGEFSEAKALQRWQNGEFEEMEKEFALAWRKDLDTTDYEATFAIVKNIVPTGRKLTTLELVKEYVDEFVANSDEKILYLMFQSFGMNPNMYQMFVDAYKSSGAKNIVELAPYATYVLRVDLFFYVAMIKGLISPDRPSNKIDIAYLYYLPFCQVFTSADKLHAKTVPLFCEQGQLFLPGGELKKACKEMDDYYSQYQDEIEERGLMSFVGCPPYTMSNAITKAWDEFCLPSWRDPIDGVPPGVQKPIEKSDVGSNPTVKEMMSAKEVEGATGKEKIDFVTVTHKMRARRGKYKMVSQDVIDAGKKKDA